MVADSARFELGLRGGELALMNERIDLVHQRLNQFNVALVLGPNKSRDDAINYSLDVHISLFRCP